MAVKQEKERWIATRIEDGVLRRQGEFTEAALQEAEGYAAEVAGSAGNSDLSTDTIASEASGKSDNRAYIDVWQFRREIAPVEALQASDDTDSCYLEGDGSETPEQIAAQQQESERCERRIHEKFKRYSDARKTLNSHWLPLMSDAISGGDHVAEVIMRQCDTTPVLDREKFESTCDESEERRAFAVERLKAIGFVPAVPFSPKLPSGFQRVGSIESQDTAMEASQEEAIERMTFGALGGFSLHSVSRGGNVAYNQIQIELYRRCNLILETLGEVRLAFSLATMTDVWDGRTSTDQQALSQLRLNRSPAKGPLNTAADFFGSDSDCGQTPFVVYWHGRQSKFPASNSATSPAHVDRMARHQLLMSIYTNVSKYLKEDSRWRVFLIKRTKDHDWEPAQPLS